MGTPTIPLELPDEFVVLLGSPQATAARAKEALLLELLREEESSQGFAAELLGITRWEMLQLMAKLQIPSGPESAEEALQEIEDLHRLLQAHWVDGGDQQ